MTYSFPTYTHLLIAKWTTPGGISFAMYCICMYLYVFVCIYMYVYVFAIGCVTHSGKENTGSVTHNVPGRILEV